MSGSWRPRRPALDHAAGSSRGHGRRDWHRLAAMAPAASGARCSSSSAGRPTWSMKICSSETSSTSKWVTVAPRRDGRRQDRVGFDALVELDLGPVDSRRGGSGRRARPSSHGSRWSPSTDTWTSRRPAARRISRSGPPTTTRPRSTIAIDSQSASTVSIWWVEKISVLPCVAQLEERLAQDRDVDRIEAR